jgi:peptidyl-prolyl cis-trans isomerase C
MVTNLLTSAPSSWFWTLHDTCAIVPGIVAHPFNIIVNFSKWNPNRRNKMPKARARHILVDSKEKCEELKNEITAGADFGEVAKQHSTCPSGKQGGDLGEFGPGQMVKEFDEVVFSGEVNTVHGPVKTQFGYHLLEITNRTE